MLPALLGIAQQLFDILKDRLARLAAAQRWAHLWSSAVSKLLAQDRITLDALTRLLEETQLLSANGIQHVWASVGELVSAEVKSAAHLSPDSTTNDVGTRGELTAHTAVEALAGAVLTSMQVEQLPGRQSGWDDAVLAATFRDIGWLSMQSYLRWGQGSDRVVSLYQQHPLVGRAVMGCVSGASPQLCDAIALHHERCDGGGLNGEPLDRQTSRARLVAAVTRLIDLTRLVPRDEVLRTLCDEASAGQWDKDLVNRLARPARLATAQAKFDGWVPERVWWSTALPSTAGTLRELHSEHTQLQGLHASLSTNLIVSRNLPLHAPIQALPL